MLRNIVSFIFIYIFIISCDNNVVGSSPCHNCVLELSLRNMEIQSDGYYHINLIDPEISGVPQTLHKFGAQVTSFDKYNLPTMCVWACDKFWYTPDTLGTTYIEIGSVPTGESPWSFENFVVTGYGGMTVPVVNGTSYADPNIDSVFCMMAPVWEMRFDTITIHGQAWFEEGDIILTDSIQVILN